MQKEKLGQVIAVNDEVLKPRSVTMPDGRDIKSIEYKIDIFAYEQKRKEESIVLKIVRDMSEQLKSSLGRRNVKRRRDDIQ